MSAAEPNGGRRPLIGLSGRRWPIERIPHFAYEALAGEEVDVHLSEYPKAIAAVGGLPIQLTRNTDPADIVSRLDGLVMTGGADPDPQLYDQDPHPALGEVERGRDDWELGLIRAALEARLPMLCVCRGAQLLNIALGGTLVQHLDEHETHARWDVPRVERCHSVRGDARFPGRRIVRRRGVHEQLASPGRRPPGRGRGGHRRSRRRCDRGVRGCRAARSVRSAVAPRDARRPTRSGFLVVGARRPSITI